MYPIYRCNVLRRGSVLDILIENEASRSISITLPSFRTTLSRLSGSEPTTFYVDGLRPFRDRLQFTFIWLQCGITLHPRRANQPLISTVQLHVLSVFFRSVGAAFLLIFEKSGFCRNLPDPAISAGHIFIPGLFILMRFGPSGSVGKYRPAIRISSQSSVSFEQEIYAPVYNGLR